MRKTSDPRMSGVGKFQESTVSGTPIFPHILIFLIPVTESTPTPRPRTKLSSLFLHVRHSVSYPSIDNSSSPPLTDTTHIVLQVSKMSVFTKSAFTMSALPSPNTSQPPSAAPSRRGSFANGLASGQLTPVTDPHIVSINVESVLFDMDGTLINSSPAVVKAWELFAEKYPLDLDDILRCE